MKKYVLIGDGESVHLLKWAKELSDYFELYLISFRSAHSDIDLYIPSKNQFKLNLQISENGGNVHVLKKVFKINFILKQIKPDIVNAHYITTYGLIAAICKRVFKHNFILIQSTWGTDILVSPFRNRIYMLLAKFSLNSASIITSDSQKMTKVIEEISIKKVDTFCFGISHLPIIEIDEKDEHLYFSNRALSQNYNIDKVIDFFSEIRKYDMLAQLLISNDGNLRPELEQKVKKMGLSDCIQFLGFLNQDTQSDIYRKAMFYISIPTSDSTSVSLLEAMSFGCIPILSDIEANQEWIQNGKNGFFVGTRISDLIQLKSNSNEIFLKNRKIISKRAIFSNSIRQFLEDNRLLK